MIFSNIFELGLFILGLLYVGNMYLDSCIDIVRLNHEIDEEEEDKKHDEEVKKLVQHLYS